MEDIVVKEISFCPFCRSKKFRKIQEDLYLCPKCDRLLMIREKSPVVCYSCGRKIFDPVQVVSLGNGKQKCKRCRPLRKREKDANSSG